MVHTCAAFACSERYEKTSGVTFHLFPKDPDIRAKWILAVRRKDDDGQLWHPSQHSCLCSRHFTEDCFYRGVYEWSRRRLFPNAIPTIFAYPPLQQSVVHHPKAVQPWTGAGRPRSKRLQTVSIGSDNGLKPSDAVGTRSPRELKRKLVISATPLENDGRKIKMTSAELQVSNGEAEMPQDTLINFKQERHSADEDELMNEPYLTEISPEVVVYENAARNDAETRNGTMEDQSSWIVKPPGKTNTAIEVNLPSDDGEPCSEQSECNRSTERTKWSTSDDIMRINNGGPTPKKSQRVKHTAVRAVTDWSSSHNDTSRSVDDEPFLEKNGHEHSSLTSASDDGVSINSGLGEKKCRVKRIAVRAVGERPSSNNDTSIFLEKNRHKHSIVSNNVSEVSPQKTSELATECNFRSQRTKSVADQAANHLCLKLELETKRCSDLEKDNWKLQLQVAERNKTIVSLEATSAQLKERLEILTIVNEQLKTRVEFETSAKNRYKEDYDELLKQIC